MPIDFEQLRDLLSAIAQTGLTEVILKSEDFELTVRRGMATIPENLPVSETVNLAVAPVPTPKPTVSVASAVEAAPPPVDSKLVEITSPMVGTFYRASAPDEAPFVENGDRVSKGQTVCIIEAMKLMNEIEAEVSGQVMEILVANAEPIEYGQVLMRVKPD